jgi:molybdate/tungstate transport system substrate-binding protein
MPLGRRKIIIVWVAVVAIMATIAGMISCGSGERKVQLKISNAASLIVPLQAMEKEFESKYPNIDVMLEGHGSLQVIRSVTELGENVDLAAVADYQLVPLLMYPAQMPENRGPYADWCIEFATNKLGIAYTTDSMYSTEISAQNWYEILSRPDVRIGLADPRIDSLGYRALMAIQLAQNYYKDNTLFEKLIIDNFSAGFEVVNAQGVTTIKIPQLVKPTQQRISLRSYSIQLLALLESGDIDYGFEYESVDKQRGLMFLELPPEIDLSSLDYAGQYKKVRVELRFQRFATIEPRFEGTQIIYGITIPRNAPHPREAEKFLEFLLGPDGQRILAENYQPALVPAEADGIDNMPAGLKPFIK